MNIQTLITGNNLLTPDDYKVWTDFYRFPNYLVPAQKLLTEDTPVFAMGSCFALEIRTALIRAGRKVYPDYVSVPYDRARQIYDRIPERYGLSFFDTFTMRQEFEAALGVWTDREASFCLVRNGPVNRMLDADEVWQDPTRKLVYGKTRADLVELTNRIDAATREGIAQAPVIVLTLGLTEAWRHNVTGRFLCTAPGAGYGGGEGLGTFHLSTFGENYVNLCVLLSLLYRHYPDKHVILTVSPVHLQQTSSDVDVGTASMESKSILRAVAGQIAREFKNVTYFPSYEMAQFSLVPVFVDDGRHVRQDFAARVVASFLGTFS